jgi:ferrochelatase
VVDFVDSWHDNPIFHRAVGERITNALTRFQESAEVHILFTAHSLPERILQYNDPYPKQLADSCQAVANLLSLDGWSSAYQSAGHTQEEWLGPDILEALGKLSSASTRHVNVLVVPIGFAADHLEILYDIDVEAQEFAKNHGMTLMRTESLNTSPIFISALADVIKRRLAQS